MTMATEVPKEQEPKPVAWSFTYTGPVEQVDDRHCEMCNAAAMGKCGKDPARHGQNPEACSTCQAARHGHCHNHCGVAFALNEHTKEHPLDAAHAPTFDVAKKALASFIATLPKDVTGVAVKAEAHQDQPDAPFAQFRIEVTASK